jgi:hypothetical protein
MALPTNLTTNEVKNASGTEVEFLHFDAPPRGKIYHNAAVAPSEPQRIRFSHEESGISLKNKRRSLMETSIGVTGNDALGTPGKIVIRTVAEIPLGLLADFNDVAKAMAYHVSLLASQGASTTILYDGTGYGAAALINGTL